MHSNTRVNSSITLYDFRPTMFVCYMQDSKAQITAIHLIIGTLQRMNIFGVENRDTLTHKTTGVTITMLFPY